MARRDTSQPIPDLLEGYNPDDPESLAVVEERVIAQTKLAFLETPPTQESFIRIKNNRGRTPRVRVFEAGNQCLTANSLVETPDGEVSVGELLKRGNSFKVYSWNGHEKVLSDALPVFSKGAPTRCYRVTLSDGRWIEASPDHLLLCGVDLYRTVSSLQEFFAGPLASSLERDLSVLPSGALRLSRTASDFLDCCSLDSRLRDEQLLLASGIVPASSPSPDGALQHKGRSSSRMDGLGSRSASIPYTSHDRPSSQDALGHSLVRVFESVGQVFGKLSQWFQRGHRSHQRPSIAESVQLQSCDGFSQGQNRSSSGVVSCVNPPEYGNHIVSIQVIPGQEVYDFCVPFYHNYYAAGLVNHNSGKTVGGVAEDIAHAMGFRPWLSKSDPDYRIPIRVPNSGFVGCEVAGQNLIQRIEPLFMEFIPRYCGAVPTRYSDGAIKSLTLTYDFNGNPCGSVINFRSYIQPAESYEGVVSHWGHFDEPPPVDILTAATRGLMSTNGPLWLTMTPLKEPYIYDLFSIKAFNNGGSDQEVAIFRCSTWENCQDWCRDCNVTILENDPDNLKPGQTRPVSHCPSCGKVMGFMPRAGIENYLKKISDPDEREAREEGKWKHLSGLVYKELDRGVHLYEDFQIPNDWMRIEVLDPHDARPCCWLFGAVSPEDIMVNGTSANRIYWYSYLRPSGNIESICRQVRVKRAEHNYKQPAMLIIDVKFAAAEKPLHGEVFPSWEEELEKAGMKNIVHSCSAPGDVSLGHKRVKEYMAPHYSAVRGVSFPGMLWAKEGCKGDGGPVQHVFNYQWKEGTDKPEEKYKDFCDCIRYAALEQPVYAAPQPDIDPELARRLMAAQDNQPQGSPLFYGLGVK